MEDKLFEMARKRVKEKKDFYQHLSVYLAVGAFFFIINLFNFYLAFEWWLFIMIPWGAALTIHYFSVFGLPGGALSREWEERELRREMDRLRHKVRRLEAPRQTEGLELPSLREDRSEKPSSWREDDLV